MWHRTGTRDDGVNEGRDKSRPSSGLVTAQGRCTATCSRGPAPIILNKRN